MPLFYEDLPLLLLFNALSVRYSDFLLYINFLLYKNLYCICLYIYNIIII